MVIRVYSEVSVWHWKLFRLDVPSSASDALHTHTHSQESASHNNCILCHLHWHCPEAPHQPEIKIFLTDTCLHIRKCKPVSKWCISHTNVTNNKHTFSKPHGAISKIINMLCIAIFLRGMGFNHKSWLGLHEYIRAYDRRRPWASPVLTAQDTVHLRVLQASDVHCLCSSEKANQTLNAQDLEPFLSYPPQLWISQCGDAKRMAPAGRREGSWCRACPSPTCYICSQKSFLPPSTLFFF